MRKRKHFVSINSSIEDEEIVEKESKRHGFNIWEIAKDVIQAQHYILLLLGAQGPHTTREIYEVMREAGYNIKRSADISARVYWLKKQGLVETGEDRRHRLTRKGETIYNTLKNIYLDYAKSSENIRKLLTTLGIFQTGLDLLKLTKIDLISFVPKILEEISKIFELSSDEQVIIKYLLEYYIKYGSIYITIDMILDDLGYDPRYLKNVLNKLRVKRLIYIYMNRTERTIRVGFKPEIRNLIKEYLRHSSSRYTSMGLLEYVDSDETVGNNKSF